MTSARRSEPSPAVEDFRAYAATVVRIVEVQHKISTDRLVDGPAEQEVLETLVEEVKPRMPEAARGLHHLLGTPFRYGYWRATRFRRAHERPGVFYAAETERTAVAETAFHILRFFSAAPAMILPSTTLEHFAFSIPVKVARALDLTEPPFSAARSLWTRGKDHGPCQRFASAARAIDAQLIRYESVRDPGAGRNVALFDAHAFRKPVPKAEQSWLFRFRGHHLTAFAAGEAERHDFSFDQFGLAAP
jgi:hypothetical protein